MRPSTNRVENALMPFVTIQDNKKYMPKENVDKATDLVTDSFSDCFCEVSPHPDSPIFIFKVARAKRVFLKL
jgi:hypothetical protein